jgi:hypothetical protein
MTDTKSFIESVLASGVLIDSMTMLSPTGATDIELDAAAKRVGKNINSELAEFLRNYDGADLDVLRIYSCERLKETDYGVAFADDPAGFVYYLADSGDVVMEDTDGGHVKRIATSIKDFIHEYVFGKRSAEFAGEEWYDELVRAGITT